MIRVFTFILGVFGVQLMVAGCGSSSSSDEEGGGAAFSGNMQNLAGTITSQSGTPAQMKSWAVALVERDSAVARVADADASGILKWNKVSLDSVQTAFLLSPDYLVQSVMAIPSTKINTVRQYFQVSSTVLPQLVQKGAALTFRTTSGITVIDQKAADTDGDGSPDGVGSLGLAPRELGLVDSDSDGLHNEYDIDIDGDGLINTIDGDADGDGILDVFDADANANLVTDSQESVGNAYYNQGIEYFTVKYEQGTSANTLQFVVKVRDGLTAASVKIKGPSSLLDGSTNTVGSGGAWDLSLVDDGDNGDGAAQDLLYSRKIQLAAGKTPRVNQVLFAQVTFGTGDSAFTIDYPWLFPNLALSAITTSYDASKREISLSGNPFGTDFQSFVWSVTITNSSGLKVYESSPLSGSVRALTIPANIMQSGASYTYEAVAQTLDKIPGLPAMAVRSAVGSISN
jgi:hypothetical protein